MEATITRAMRPWARQTSGAFGRGLAVHPRTTGRPAPEEAGVERPWSEVLRGLAQGDPLAHARISGLIMALLAKSRAVDLEPLWEDICQDVLTTLVRSARSGAIRDPRAFVGYCAVITRHELAARIRRIQRNRERSAEVLEDALPEAGWREGELERRVELSRALDRLPEHLRRTIDATYLQGRTCEDAAEHLGISLGTLKRWKGQAFQMLREALLGADAAASRTPRLR